MSGNTIILGWRSARVTCRREPLTRGLAGFVAGLVAGTAVVQALQRKPRTLGSWRWRSPRWRIGASDGKAVWRLSFELKRLYLTRVLHGRSAKLGSDFTIPSETSMTNETRGVPSAGGAQPRRTRPALERIAATFAWGLGFAVTALLIWILSDVVLLVFASILLACVLNAGAASIARRTGIPRWVGLVIILAAFSALIGVSGWLRGPVVVREVVEVGQQLTEQANAIWQRLGEAQWARTLADKARSYLAQADGKIAGVATGVATSTLGVLGSLLVVIAAGIYFAAAPETYVEGTLKLMPRGWRPRGHEVLTELGRTMAQWFVGQLLDMVVIGVLTGIGLTLLGVKLALTLALIAALLNFIPFIGALAGAVPAILVAFGQGPHVALYVALLFIVIQTIEGNVVAPLVQKQTVNLPPVLTILSQTVLGSIFGALGLILATPLAAVAMVGVKLVYVETILGDTSEKK